MAAARLQTTVGDNAATTGVININPGAATTAGSLVVALVGQYGGAPGAPTIADSAGQTWTQAISSSPRGSIRGSIFYKANSASITTCAVTPSNIGSAVFLEYSGVAAAPTVTCVAAFTDQAAVTSWASNSISPAASCLLVGVAWDIFLANASFAASGAWSAGTRFNNATDGDDAWFEEQLNAAAGTYQATGTCTSSEINAGVIAFSLAASTAVVDHSKFSPIPFQAQGRNL